MLEVPFLREIYLSGVIVTSLYIAFLSMSGFREIKYQGSFITLIADILSPLFMAAIAILFMSGFSWAGLFIAIHIKDKIR